MPTKPNLNFVPRDIRKDEGLSKILDYLSEFIEETVNFSSQAIDWCIKNVREGTEYALVFLIYRHIFEMVDAISILVSQSCIEPCKIILRSIFEALLSAEYILEKDIKQRALDFFVWSRHQEIDTLRRWNPQDPLYKIFDAILKEDNVLSTWERPDIPNIKEQIDKLLEELEKEPFLNSEREYQRLKDKNKKKLSPKYWFNLHDGPKNIKTLSGHLSRSGQYEILYRPWSALAHSIDVLRGKIEVDESKIASFSQLRNPVNAEIITVFAVYFAVTIINLFINIFAKEKVSETKDWYNEEIKDKYSDLVISKKIIVK